MRTCNKCGKTKGDEEFYWNYSTGGVSGPGAVRRPYRRGDCKACFKNERKGKGISYKKAGRPIRPPAGTPCECCLKVPYSREGNAERLFKDHTHTVSPDDSVMRGWVCRRCNGTVLASGEGLLELAQAYIKRNGTHLLVTPELILVEEGIGVEGGGSGSCVEQQALLGLDPVGCVHEPVAVSVR